MAVNQQVSIITGAGSGIGRALALLLGQRGDHLTLVGRTRSKLEATAQMIQTDAANRQTEILICETDITDEANCQKIVSQTLAKFTTIDVLANVAGQATMLSIAQITSQNLRQCFDTNLSAVMYLTAAVWPTFEKKQTGVIANVSSMASFDPFPGFCLYAPAKAAVNMFTRVCANEGKELGIKVFAIAPGAVETPMLRSLFDEKAIPCDQTLSPQKVAQTIYDGIIGQSAIESGQTIALPSPIK